MILGNAPKLGEKPSPVKEKERSNGRAKGMSLGPLEAVSRENSGELARGISEERVPPYSQKHAFLWVVLIIVLFTLGSFWVTGTILMLIASLFMQG